MSSDPVSNKISDVKSDISPPYKLKMQTDTLLPVEQSFKRQEKKLAVTDLSCYLPTIINTFDEYGRINTHYQELYTQYIKKNPEGSYSKILTPIVRGTLKTDGYITEDLHIFLENKGAAPSTLTERCPKFNFAKTQHKLLSSLPSANVSLLSLPLDEIIEVSNSDDFLAYIGNDRILKIKNNLSIDSLCSSNNPNAYILDGSCVIENVDNLTILGAGYSPSIITVDSPKEAIRFSNCTNVILRNVSIRSKTDKHTSPVLTLSEVEKLRIENSVIFGSNGPCLKFNNIVDVKIINSLLWTLDYDISSKNLDGCTLQNTFLYNNNKLKQAEF